ncbi:MAG TPA: sugar kinase [Gemmatimonadaceae bacterium]|nr:sugar kinase [Gemmatimonadaceae bacterium]
MDLVTFGEAMVRLTPPAFQRLEQAHSFDAYVGGGELNVAVAAARLGVASRWVSRLPENALGRMIANHAREQGVEVHVDWTADDRAGLYFAELGAAPRASSVLYDRATSAISRVTPGTIDWASVFEGARWYHVSGITPALSDGAAKVTAESMAAAKKAGLTVSYDLNYRSKLWSAKKAHAVQEPLMEHVDVLITTEEDTRVVFGIGGESRDEYAHVDAESHAEVARALEKRFELSAVAITLRENPRVLLNTWSAIVAADGKVHAAPRYEVEVVDRIGAGDAFCGGLIVSRLENRGWDEAVRFATATSALKHSIPGDFCLVTRGEVDQLLRGASLRVSR